MINELTLFYTGAEYKEYYTLTKDEAFTNLMNEHRVIDSLHYKYIANANKQYLATIDTEQNTMHVSFKMWLLFRHHYDMRDVDIKSFLKVRMFDLGYNVEPY